MKNIFIDCGFHHGEGLKHFIKLLTINSDWDVYVFEPNPECKADERLFEMYLDHYFNFRFFKSAVWTHGDGVKFRQENHFQTMSGSPTDGKSIIDGWGSHISGSQGEKWTSQPEIEVASTDLSHRVHLIGMTGCSEIYCKMDIEGAEFAVLRKMLQDDTVKYIKHLWVEFHENLVPGESLKSKRELIKQLSQHTTVTQWH